ncbi:hypothetical protein MNEG_6902 [Monoraphidium neglectum]|uniref:Uncharacterized protein n=1 Tax=Monoraphidium neglectum TaxID=145388 RepID=A0A0D2L115_9CHLO|nr:hypothetical protein MNEG_6902 [Monoraphidium neglectum]KIZ01059.1 hypothetical protein MNEG_6902 [Monoraphidium neglectum]|eukprot:XP_013900078.1 hypothetical protein MNEG_6902 [Monoraphidium neglectum]
MAPTTRPARLPAAATAAVLLLVALIAAARPAAACRVVNVDVSLAASASNATKDAYNTDGVRQHFNLDVNRVTYVNTRAATTACVDSRHEYPVIGTPGGDMCEFIVGLTVYLNQTGQTLSQALADQVLADYIRGLFSARKKFYYHTSDEKLLKVFSEIKAAAFGSPVAFPDQEPINPAERDVWYTSLSKGFNQGCGHLRLMIDNFADYGFTSSELPRAVVRAFFRYWWGTALNSRERRNINYAILQGPLVGKAVAIVDSQGACPTRSPAITSSAAASQLFVFHANAIDTIRKTTMTNWFVNYARRNAPTPLDPTAFYEGVKALQGRHLGATLRLLSPVNQLNVFNVALTTAS